MVSTYPPMKCGIGEHARHVVKSLQNAGIKPEIIRIKDRYSSNPFQFLDLARRAAKNTNEKDIIHIQFQLTIFGKLFGILPGFYIIPFLMYLKSHTKAKIVMALHDSPSKDYSMKGSKKEKLLFYYFKFIYFFLKLYVDKFIAHSKNGERINIKEWKVKREKIVTLPLGLPTNIVNLNQNKCKEKLGYKDKKILLILGYIRGSKNYDVVLDALAKLDKNFILLIAGEVQLEKDQVVYDNIVKKRDKLGLKDRVKLLGFVSDEKLTLLLNAADVGIDLRSQGGGDFLSSTMAMEIAHNIPILGSGIPSFEKLKEEEKCIETFNENDVGDITKKINVLLKDKTKIAYLKKQTKEYWKKNNWNEIGKNTKRLYLSLIK